MGTPPDQEALQSIRDRAIDTDLVYIMFTSGSTSCPASGPQSGSDSQEYLSACISPVLMPVGARVIFCEAATKKTAEALDFQGDIVLYDEISRTPPDQEALQSIRDSCGTCCGCRNTP